MVKRNFFIVIFILLSSMTITFSTAIANDIGILPPDYDYENLCIAGDEGLSDKLYNKYKDVSDLSKISNNHLTKLASLYYNGNSNTPPNYKKTLQIVNHIIATNRTNNTPYKHKALLIKYKIYLKGLGVSRNINTAKEILDILTKNNVGRAYRNYGDLYVTEKQFDLAMKYYKKAIILGEISPFFSIAKLYYNKNIPTTEKQIKLTTMQAQNAALEFIARGNCVGLKYVGLMYNYMSGLPNAEFYSVKWLEKAALLDDPLSKIHLADLITRGFATQRPIEDVLKLWEDAANLGSSRAMFMLGEYYVSNAKNDKDTQKGLSWLVKAARYHNVKAAELLSEIYNGTLGIKANSVKRRYWLETSAKHNGVSTKTLMTLANIYENINSIDAKDILAIYQKAADKGNYDAIIKIGDSYRYGIGQKAQPTKALRYYRLAANNLNKSAMKSMRNAYECEIGQKYNAEKIEFWTDQINYYNEDNTLKAAHDNLINSPHNLEPSIKDSLKFIAKTRKNSSSMIMLGMYSAIEGNQQQANSWYEKALNVDRQKNEKYSAYNLLGKYFLLGEIIKKDTDRGLKLLYAAAKKDHSGAHNILGKYFKKQNQLNRAEKYFLSAAKLGKTSAYLELSAIYKNRNDKKAAIASLITAARKHEIKAMLRLAHAYSEKGWATVPDQNKSQEWFNKALNSYPCEPDIILQISRAYIEGTNGANKDQVKAEYWLTRLGDTELKDDSSKLKLAKIILKSDLSKNKKQRDFSISILEKHANSGNNDAASILASYYLHKESSKDAVNKAVYWLEKSANQGNIESMIELSNLYISGFNIEQSTDKAVYWLEKAKDNGSSKAEIRLKNLNID